MCVRTQEFKKKLQAWSTSQYPSNHKRRIPRRSRSGMAGNESYCGQPSRDKSDIQRTEKTMPNQLVRVPTMQEVLGKIPKPNALRAIASIKGWRNDVECMSGEQKWEVRPYTNSSHQLYIETSGCDNIPMSVTNYISRQTGAENSTCNMFKEKTN